MFVTFGGNLVNAMSFAKEAEAFASIGAFFAWVPRNILWLMAAAMMTLSLAGIRRWVDESMINVHIAGQSGATNIARLNRAQAIAGRCTLVVLTFCGTVVQALVNYRFFIPLRYAEAAQDFPEPSPVEAASPDPPSHGR